MLFSYCTNIHPGESWEETFHSLRTHVPAVRQRLGRATTDPFPLGLRLGATAAAELAADRARLRRLRLWMENENLLAYTINGFPYGAFHGTRVKEQVFAPDWSDPARAAYTRQLFDLLCELLPEGAEGSVSTVPGSFKEFVAAAPDRLPAILSALRAFADTLEDMSAANNLDLHLGLEPEPLGLLEDTTDTLAFFDALTAGLDSTARSRLLRRIGICYDACHFAIAYDDARTSLDRLDQAGIRLSKVHLSNALSLDPRDPAALQALAAFNEPTYLHQVAARHPDGRIARFRDLPDALADAATPGHRPPTNGASISTSRSTPPPMRRCNPPSATSTAWPAGSTPTPANAATSRWKPTRSASSPNPSAITPSKPCSPANSNGARKISSGAEVRHTDDFPTPPRLPTLPPRR